MSDKIFTWSDLEEALNKMPLDQKGKQVFSSIEDENTFRKVEDVQFVQNDIYVKKDEKEDYGDLEALKELHGEEFNESNYELITPKGTPFLWDGF